MTSFVTIDEKSPQATKRKPSVACLLIHGLNGSPYDFIEIAEAFEQEGIFCENLLLPGHDVHHRHARVFGWPDWLTTAEEHYLALRARFEQVYVIGHSMGGSITLMLAERYPDMSGFSTLCAPVALHPSLLPLARMGQHVLPYVPIFREDISDRLERVSYRRRKVTHFAAVAPMATLLTALPEVQRGLQQITAPALIIAARNDHVVDYRDAVRIYESIRSHPKELITLERSFHVVTRDVERAIVTIHLKNFIGRLCATATHEPS